MVLNYKNVNEVQKNVNLVKIVNEHNKVQNSVNEFDKFI